VIDETASDIAQRQECTVTELDFEAAYRGGVLTDGIDGVPWEIGEAQPPMADLIRAGAVRGDTLDIGCGTGEVALLAAAHGATVTGLDISPTAISIARLKASERDTAVHFAVGDATDLSDYESAFDVVLDCTMMHCLPIEVLPRYLAELWRACRPDAVAHILVFRAASEIANVPGHHFTEAELRSLFHRTWRLEHLDRTHVLATRLPASLPLDERGRMIVPAWMVTVRRASPAPAPGDAAHEHDQQL
jgi:SAM-dependent methyltransferase